VLGTRGDNSAQGAIQNSWRDFSVGDKPGAWLRVHPVDSITLRSISRLLIIGVVGATHEQLSLAAGAAIELEYDPARRPVDPDGSAPLGCYAARLRGGPSAEGDSERAAVQALARELKRQVAGSALSPGVTPVGHAFNAARLMDLPGLVEWLEQRVVGPPLLIGLAPAWETGAEPGSQPTEIRTVGRNVLFRDEGGMSLIAAALLAAVGAAWVLRSARGARRRHRLSRSTHVR
jgi:hypothetical protein